jgi:hypothetical protein
MGIYINIKGGEDHNHNYGGICTMHTVKERLSLLPSILYDISFAHPGWWDFCTVIKIETPKNLEMMSEDSGTNLHTYISP